MAASGSGRLANPKELFAPMAAGDSDRWTASFPLPCAETDPALPAALQAVEPKAGRPANRSSCLHALVLKTTGPAVPQDHYCLRPWTVWT